MANLGTESEFEETTIDRLKRLGINTQAEGRRTLKRPGDHLTDQAALAIFAF